MFAFILTLSVLAVLAAIFVSVLKNIHNDAIESVEKLYPIETSVYWARVQREAAEAAEREAEREADRRELERSVRNSITPFTIETPNVFAR